MGRLRAWKRIVFTDGGLFFGVFVTLAVGFAVRTYLCWGRPDMGGPLDQHAHLENCKAAQREIGARVLEAHPECADVLAPQPAAKTASQ